jgi:hypothetical protein
MHILADENFPGDAIDALQKRDHVAVAALESRTDWTGHFAVVEDERIRMTPLPRRR